MAKTNKKETETKVGKKSTVKSPETETTITDKKNGATQKNLKVSGNSTESSEPAKQKTAKAAKTKTAVSKTVPTEAKSVPETKPATVAEKPKTAIAAAKPVKEKAAKTSANKIMSGKDNKPKTEMTALPVAEPLADAKSNHNVEAKSAVKAPSEDLQVHKEHAGAPAISHNAPAEHSRPNPSKKSEPVPQMEIDPNIRFSDEDLAMFADVILSSKVEQLDELRMLKERLDDLTSPDMAEESMIYSMHMAEQGSEAMEKEKTFAQIQRISEYIKKLDEALDRIKNKSYGICRMCGCLIAKERLLAVPITTLSASYKIHQKCPEDGIDRIEPVRKR